MTHLLNIMAFPLQPKIRTMTAMTVTVLRNLKEPCGTWSVIAQTSMVTIIMGSTHRMWMESTGITDIEINIFITVMRNFHFRVLLVRMQQIQRPG